MAQRGSIFPVVLCIVWHKGIALKSRQLARPEQAAGQEVQMETTGAVQAREKMATRVAPTVDRRPPAQAATKPVDAKDPISHGYGLPCAHCRAYYPSDMQACPICHSKERISPNTGAQFPAAPAAPQSEQAKLLAEERERLRELKSQIYASHPPVASSTFRCALDQNHNGNMEPAAVCHSCYGEARQHADRMEAALHMDSREAAKIVYEAVWADSSDPNKTYLNAANALLSELRQRAGIGLLLGANRPLSH